MKWNDNVTCPKCKGVNSSSGNWKCNVCDGTGEAGKTTAKRYKDEKGRKEDFAIGKYYFDKKYKCGTYENR